MCSLIAVAKRLACPGDAAEGSDKAATAGALSGCVSASRLEVLPGQGSTTRAASEQPSMEVRRRGPRSAETWATVSGDVGHSQRRLGPRLAATLATVSGDVGHDWLRVGLASAGVRGMGARGEAVASSYCRETHN